VSSDQSLRLLWMMATKNPDEFTARMFEPINGMLLDMLAAVARKTIGAAGRRKVRPRPTAGDQMRC
jgi:hypothetical protein